MTQTQVSFHKIDLHFARFICRLAPGAETPVIYAALALVSRALQEGSICLNLEDFAGLRIVDPAAGLDILLPEVAAWASLLRQSPVVARPGQFAPLILDDRNRLYLQKYFAYEKALIDAIRKRLLPPAVVGPGACLMDLPPDRVKRILGALFPDGREGFAVSQKLALLLAARSRLTVISGGPGTGKTSTVAKIIAFLSELSGGKLPKIMLAAPTGKAAARLSELPGKNPHLFGGASGASVPRATTVHRLLGRRRMEQSLFYDDPEPLEGDLLFLDEASMLDLPLMARLFCALPESAAVIMLGDACQLGSIEAGSAFGDIYGQSVGAYNPELRKFLQDYLSTEEIKRISVRPGPAIQDCLVELKENFRFSPESPIGQLSRLVVAGEAAQAFDLIQKKGLDGLGWEELPAPEALRTRLATAVLGHLRRYFSALDRGAAPDEIFAHFQAASILCALRHGRYGSLAINSMIEMLLRAERLIAGESHIYPGRPVMVTCNDYRVELFNGDIGIILPDRGSREGFSVFFPASDHPGGMRRVPLALLPQHETIYAMTIHKSQGTEYEEVLLVLPDTDLPLLTRELIYTAITRARQKIQIWGKKEVFLRGVERRIRRQSGLREALWET